MTDFLPLPPETIAHARQLYDSAAPNAEICAFLGMTEKQFLAFRKAQGWPLRDRFAIPPGRGPAWAQDHLAEDEWEAPLESLTPEELIKRMEAAAAHEFARAERAAQQSAAKSRGAPADHGASRENAVRTQAHAPRQREERGERAA